MMDQERSKGKLIKELAGERQRMAELENSVTKHKLTEKTYQTLVENSLQGLVIIQNGRVVFANPAAVKMSGYRLKELLSFSQKDVKAVVHPEDREHIMKAMQDRMDGKQVPTVHEFRLRRKDGTFCWIKTMASKTEYQGKPAIQVTYIDVTKYKRAEEALGELEKKYHTLIDNAPVGVYTSTLKGELLYVNKALLELSGFDSLDDMNAIGLVNMYKNPADREFLIKKLKEEGKVDNLELELYTKKKKINNVLLNGVLDGETISGMIIDISERKRSEEIVKESERRFKELWDNAPVAYHTLDTRGIITSLNQTEAEMLGYTKEEMLGRSMFDFVLPEQRTDARRRFRRKIAGQRVPRAENRVYVRKNGSKIYVAIDDVLERNKKGKVRGVRTTMVDITDRQRAEEELRESKDKFIRMFNRVFDAIIIINPKGKIIDVNETVCKLLGYSKEELMKFSVEDIHPKEEMKKINTAIRRVLKNGIDYMGETAFVSKKGEIMQIEAGGVTLKVGDDTFIMGSFRDITERKRAEEKLLVSLKEKEVLLREIHHRVKNNMQIISSLLRLQSRTIKDEKMQEKFNMAQNRIRSMALVHESLYKATDLARINLSDYVDMLATHLLSLYKLKKGHAKFNSDIKDIYLDINRAIPCGLIISEVVSNALKHAFPKGTGGEINVIGRVNKRGKYTLRIHDTGVGIPKGLDLHQTDTLGIQLVMDLVKQIGGTIKLIREGGTSFVITF